MIYINSPDEKPTVEELSAYVTRPMDEHQKTAFFVLTTCIICNCTPTAAMKMLTDLANKMKAQNPQP
jgi:hypothetical protein